MAYQLEKAGIPYKKIVETDGPFANQVMAIGVVPCERELVRKLLRGLPLVR